MFGLSQKERAAEALRRGALAAMSGGYFHHSHAAAFGLNEQATAYLYTDAIAHQIYALGYIASRALSGKKWAGPDFFFGAVVRGLREAEARAELAPDSMVSVALKRYSELEAIPTESAANGGRYFDTVRRVKDFDPGANEQAIKDALETATMAYFHDASKMFA